MKKGFSLVEILVAISLFGIFVVLFFSFFQTNRNSYEKVVSNNKAVAFAKEGIEAVRNIRDENFVDLVNGTWGLSTTTNKWQLNGSSTINENFIREIIISEIDSQTKKVESKVSYNLFDSTSTISLITYLTYWQEFYTNIGNWALPLKDGFTSLTGGLKVDISGNYAYVITSTSIRSYNISNTAAPSFVSSLALSGTLTDIFINGNYAFISSTSNTQEVQIVNISNPSSMSVSKTVDLNGNNDANSIFVSGNYAYVVKQSGSPNFFVVNVSSIPSASIIGTHNTGSENLADVYVSGNYAFVSSNANSQDLRILNVSNAAFPSSASAVNLSGGGGVSTNDDAKSIKGFGNYLYVVQNDISGPQNSVIYLFNIIDPTTPALSNQVNVSGGSINDLSVGNSGQYAFAGTNLSAQEFIVYNGNLTNNTLTVLGSYNATTSQSFLGVDYDQTLDRVAAVSNYTAEGFIIIKPSP